MVAAESAGQRLSGSNPRGQKQVGEPDRQQPAPPPPPSQSSLIKSHRGFRIPDSFLWGFFAQLLVFVFRRTSISCVLVAILTLLSMRALFEYVAVESNYYMKMSNIGKGRRTGETRRRWGGNRCMSHSGVGETHLPMQKKSIKEKPHTM